MLFIARRALCSYYHFLKMKKIKKFVYVIFGLVLFCALAFTCVAGGDKSSTSRTIVMNEGVAMRVLWTVSAYHLDKDSVWGEAEARSMLFKPLDISSSTITFNGQSCHDVTFSNEKVNTGQYLEKRYQTTPQALDLDDGTITVIKTNCALPEFKEYIRLPDRRLIVAIHGVFFVFEPTVNY